MPEQGKVARSWKR
uniref:Uncharacterized protein n=1 Tax=Arundo donax TaxID=35708 RepID=A0A0A9CD36_ARUDO